MQFETSLSAAVVPGLLVPLSPVVESTTTSSLIILIKGVTILAYMASKGVLSSTTPSDLVDSDISAVPLSTQDGT